MKRGEIVEITPSGLYQRQWLVQGSAQEPYKVSLTKSGCWQCGCPAGRTTKGGMEADACKHTLRVQLSVGMPHRASIETLVGVIADPVEPTNIRRFRD